MTRVHSGTASVRLSQGGHDGVPNRRRALFTDPRRPGPFLHLLSTALGEHDAGAIHLYPAPSQSSVLFHHSDRYSRGGRIDIPVTSSSLAMIHLGRIGYSLPLAVYRPHLLGRNQVGTNSCCHSVALRGGDKADCRSVEEGPKREGMEFASAELGRRLEAIEIPFRPSDRTGKPRGIADV